jgi:cytochrome P450
MSDIEMISQCILFFFAGYETTATTLSFAAYNIACHPEVQQKLYEESKAVFDSGVIIID